MNDILMHVGLIAVASVLYVWARYQGRDIFRGEGFSGLDAIMAMWLPAMLVCGFIKGLNEMIKADLFVAICVFYAASTMKLVRWVGDRRGWGMNRKEGWWLGLVLTPTAIFLGLVVWIVKAGQ